MSKQDNRGGQEGKISVARSGCRYQFDGSAARRLLATASGRAARPRHLAIETSLPPEAALGETLAELRGVVKRVFLGEAIEFRSTQYKNRRKLSAYLPVTVHYVKRFCLITELGV